MTDSAQASKRRAAIMFAVAGVLIALAAIAITIAMRRGDAAQPEPDHSYPLVYTVAFLPAQEAADVTIAVSPGNGVLRELRMRMPAERYTQVEGDGSLRRDGDVVVWRPEPDRPQKLRYRYRINERRTNGGYDARITADWAIVRGDDLVPPTATRATKGADSRARLVFLLPDGWATVDTPYVRSRDGESFVLATPNRNFDRPLGWIVAGDIGVRRERARGTRLSVAGPTGQDARRMDTMAFLNVLLPEYREAFGELPPKLLVVLAGDPMWNGGLSGPRSLFLHAHRPLISENGTSTLAHEMTHVVTRIRGAAGDDWIAEGLAEFYAIELPRRARLITRSRARSAWAWMREHGADVTTLTADASSRDRTARAVQLFQDLDAEVRERSDDAHDLDDVVRRLITDREVSRDDLRAAVVDVTGEESKVLATPLLDRAPATSP